MRMEYQVATLAAGKQLGNQVSGTIAGYIRAEQGVPRPRAGMRNPGHSRRGDSHTPVGKRAPCCYNSRDRNPATPFQARGHTRHNRLHDGAGARDGDAHGGRGHGRPKPESKGAIQAA
jgi:hypothetical protein